MGLYTADLYADTYPYITVEEFQDGCKAAASLETDAPMIDAIVDASLVMYNLTGRIYNGTSTATIRPCVPDACGCGGCRPNAVNLRLWPVTAIKRVRYQGVDYTTPEEIAEIWHVDEHRYLVRNDGDRVIYQQNAYAVVGGDKDNASDGWVFEVEFEYGLTVPSIMKRATKALACELLEASIGNECRLPERVTTVSRQGVTLDTMSASDFLREGRTGIYAVDLALQILNPSKIQSPAFVWSPDVAYSRQVGT